MSDTTAALNPQTNQADSDAIEALQTSLVRSPMASRVLIVGLPLLGMAASLCLRLPLFAGLMSASFLFATSLVCRKAILTFAGTTLRLLAMVRMVLILVLAALLFCTTGTAWTCLVSALLLWLVTDRLLGRRALHDLWKLCRARP